MSYYKFDRRELFNQKDVDTVSGIIQELMYISIEEDLGDDEDKFNDLENKLYGLFDGYLYDDILSTAVSFPQIPVETCKRLEVIVDKVTNDILVNGQRLTAV